MVVSDDLRRHSEKPKIQEKNNNIKQINVFFQMYLPIVTMTDNNVILNRG